VRGKLGPARIETAEGQRYDHQRFTAQKNEAGPHFFLCFLCCLDMPFLVCAKEHCTFCNSYHFAALLLAPANASSQQTFEMSKVFFSSFHAWHP
jgi:hypothetical protein